RRRRVLTASLTAWAVTGLLLLFFATPPWTAGWLSLLLHTTLGYGIIQGVTVRGPLFCRLRHCLRQICHSDWLLAGVGMLLFCVLLTILGVVWLWWGFALIGLGLGGLLHVLLDRPVLEERRRPVEACARLLRRLRNQGIAEEQLRLFVARYAGRHWEEFFEALFGYEAKLEVRNRLGATACSAQRERHAAWREPLIAWLDRWEAQRQMLRERRWLTRVEQARLLADGNQAEVAAVKAQQAAEALIQRAGQLRAAEQPWRSSLHLSPGLSSQSLFGSSLFWGSMPGSASSSTAPSRLNWSDRLLTLLLGTSTRCLLAACLLAAFALWACQNARGILQTTPSANSATGHALSQTQRDVDHIWEYLMLPTEPLQLPPLPSRYTAWINGWNIGVAAMLLLVSLFYRGHVMGLFVLLGVLVTAFGAHYGIRTAEPLRPEHTALILGTTLTLIGLRCARTT
ncbi:MAG: hypothetical protein NZ703_11715, partial [Gemmataceae bacterium]|nr:hypothetical protein [Gemmataceae bacterium]